MLIDEVGYIIRRYESVDGHASVEIGIGEPEISEGHRRRLVSPAREQTLRPLREYKEWGRTIEVGVTSEQLQALRINQKVRIRVEPL